MSVARPKLFFPEPLHADVLAALDAECYSLKLTPSRWRKQLLKKKAVCIVAGTLEHPIAYALAELNGDTLELLRLGVRPSNRREGVGRMMVEVIGSTLPLYLTLRETHAEALAFAKGCGFVAFELQRSVYPTCDGIRLRRNPEKIAVGT